MTLERTPMRKLIPQERSWVPCACVMGCALALMMLSWVAASRSSAVAVDVVFLVAAFVAGALGLGHMQSRGVVYSDRVLSLALALSGVVYLVGSFVPYDVLFRGCLLAVCLALDVGLYIAPARLRPQADSAVAVDKGQLARPLRYLVFFSACLGLSEGLIMHYVAPLLAAPEGALGYGAGMLSAGVLMWAFMLCTLPKRGLDVVTRSALLCVVAGSLVVLQILPSSAPVAALTFAGLCLLAAGTGLLTFLVTRMSLDLHEVFKLARFMPFATVSLLYAAFGLGSLAAAGVSLVDPGARIWVVLVAVILLVVAIVYGLTSERVWTARELRDAMSAPASDRPQRATWRIACEKVAEDACLTPREREVFALLAKGRNSAFIEKELCISNHTVKTHTLNVYRKLGVHSLQEVIDLVESARCEAQE